MKIYFFISTIYALCVFANASFMENKTHNLTSYYEEYPIYMDLDKPLVTHQLLKSQEIKIKREDNRSLEAEARLQSVFFHMKSFLHDTYFEYFEFEDYSGTIQKELDNISVLINSFSPENEILKKRLRFSKLSSQNLLAYVRIIKRYNFLGQKDHELLSQMVEINALILAFYDIEGKINFLSPDYIERIVYLFQSLCTCEERFDDLLEVSEDIKLSFEYHTKQATEKLSSLLINFPIAPHSEL